VNLDGGEIRINRTLQPLGVLDTKTEQSARTIPIPKSAVSAIREYRRVQAEWKIAYPDRERWHPDWVFTSHTGAPIDPRNVDRWYHRALKRAGVVRHLRFHDLRHTYATHLLTSGMNVKEVSVLLGHSSPTTTLSTYAHTLPTRERVGADVMERLTASP
jgi:integrase